MIKFYSALPVIAPIELVECHVTTMFSDLVATPRMETSHVSMSNWQLIRIEYWEHVDLTVAIIHCQYAHNRNDYWTAQGFKYDYEYIPHITLCKGRSESFNHLLNTNVTLGSEYFKLLDR